MASVLTDRTKRNADADGQLQSSGTPVTTRLLRMLPFLILFYIQLVHHQLWRDEINAWGLVVASPTLRALFGNVHYEAHPAFWYVLLYPASKLTHAPWMMKLVEGFIGTGIYLMLALASPLRRAEQILVYCSYFVLFEYTVMSRMYSLMLLFALVYLWSRLKYPDRLLQNAFLLGIVANTDLTGMILSGALLLEYLADSLQRRREFAVPTFAQMLQSAVVYVAMVGLSAATLWPSKQISWRTTGHVGMYLHSKVHLVYSVLNYLSLPWFPVHRSFPHEFWDARSMARPTLYFALLPVVVGSLIWIFRKRPRLLLLMGALALVGIIFTHVIYDGSMRHFGIIFIGFIAGIWILRYRHEPVSKLAYLLLALNAVGGAAAAYGQWSRPFVDDGAAVQWIRQNHLENTALIGAPDTHMVGVAERLQKPMYFLDCGCVDTYMKFSNRRDHYQDRDMPAALAKAVHTLQAPEMIFMTYEPIKAADLQALQHESISVDPLAQFTRGDLVDEHFFLYKVGLRP